MPEGVSIDSWENRCTGFAQSIVKLPSVENSHTTPIASCAEGISSQNSNNRRNLTCGWHPSVSAPTLPCPREHKVAPGHNILLHITYSHVPSHLMVMPGTIGHRSSLCFLLHTATFNFMSYHSTEQVETNPCYRRMLIQIYNPGSRGQLSSLLKSRKFQKAEYQLCDWFLGQKWAGVINYIFVNERAKLPCSSAGPATPVPDARLKTWQ